MISVKNKFIFVHIPKTAGQSISSSLMHIERVKWNDRLKHPSYLMRNAKNPSEGPTRLSHLKASQYVKCGHISQDEFDSYFKFAFVRNPWDRMVSEYKWLRLEDNGTSFESFIYNLPVGQWSDRGIHVDPQYEFVMNDKDNIIVDFIGRYENINKDFDEVCKKLGVKARLLTRNTSKKDGRPYQEYYDEKTKNVVSDIYSKDIEYFNYRFE